MKKDVKIGSQAPDFVFERADGTLGELSSLWADGPALVVWLRQCG